MISNKQRELIPLVPKGERSNFAILIALLLLIPASLAAAYCALASYMYLVSDFIISEEKQSAICMQLLVLSLMLSIFGIAEKSYRLLASAGCIFLIIIHLCIIFGATYLNMKLLILLLFCDFPLLIPAINERICQLGAPQRANRRLCIAYAFVLLFITFIVLVFFIFTEYGSYNGPIIYIKFLCLSLAFLSLFLWMISMRRKIWNATSIREDINCSSSYSRICTIANALGYPIILSILWAFMRYSEHLPLSILILSLGGLLSICWDKSPQINRMLNCVLFCTLGISIILLSSTYFGLISESILIVLVLVNMTFIPHYLADCRRALLESPSPQNKGWIHLYLLLCFPLSALCC